MIKHENSLQQGRTMDIVSTNKESQNIGSITANSDFNLLWAPIQTKMN
jgi:hypothetical protein